MHSMCSRQVRHHSRFKLVCVMSCQHLLTANRRDQSDCLSHLPGALTVCQRKLNVSMQHRVQRAGGRAVLFHNLLHSSADYLLLHAGADHHHAGADHLLLHPGAHSGSDQLLLHPGADHHHAPLRQDDVKAVHKLG